MSYTFLLATGAEYSAESYAEILQFAPWKSTEDAGKHYYNAKETGFCLGSPFGMTLKPSMADLGEELPRLSAADFHARVYHQPALIPELMDCNEDLMIKALDCGLRWKELLQKCNLNLSVLKTPRIYALKDLSESFKDLTAWGMTQGGVCLDVATSAQTISEPECSLLPTPTRHNSKEGAYPAEYTRNTPTLAAQIGGKINPDWNEWRMGCPDNWSGLDKLETDKFRQWLSLHGKL